MQIIDKLIVLSAILTISLAVYYVLYFYTSDVVVNLLAVIIGIAGFLLGLLEFIRKK